MSEFKKKEYKNIPLSEVQNDEEKYLEEIKQSENSQAKTDWISIYIAGTLTYVGAVQFSLYVASIWPYLKTIDSSANETFLGLIVSGYSIGQMIACPLVGFWSNKIKKISPPLYMGLSLMFLGNLLYFFTALFPYDRKFCILAARVIIGAGSANITLLRAYAATASIGSDRSRAIAFVTGGMAMGTITGPALQLIFVPLGPKGFHLYGDLNFSIYTAPAAAACIIDIIGAILVHFFFVENMIGVSFSKPKDDKKESLVAAPILPPYDKIAVSICYFTRFCQLLVITNFEAIGTPLAMTMFAWNAPQVVQYGAIANFCASILAFGIYAIYIKYNLGRIISSRKITMISLGGLLMLFLTTYSWPFLPGNLEVYSEKNDAIANNNDTQAVGCNSDKFSWCYIIKPVNVYLYYISYIFFTGSCFSNINISLNTLFSKIIGPRPQATQQGWLQNSGGIARAIGPVIISKMYTLYGPIWSWNLVITVIVITLCFWIIFRKRMVAISLPKEFAHFQDINDPDFKKSKK